MTEYIQREAVLKCLAYTTIWEPEAENIISLTLRAAREKVEKLPVLQEKDLFPAWRDPDKDPPEVETEVLILYRNEIGGYGITTGHYENGNIFSEDSKWNWEDLPDCGTYDEERDGYRIPEGWWEYRHFNPDDVYNNNIDCPRGGLDAAAGEAEKGGRGMSKRKYLDSETLKQHLFMEAALCYIKTLKDVNRVIDALPEAETCQKWHPASEIPLLHHEVDENKCEGTIECDVSEQLLLYTEEEGYKVGVYMKDCYGFNGWLNPDYGGTIHHVVEWQYPQKPSRERSK